MFGRDLIEDYLDSGNTGVKNALYFFLLDKEILQGIKGAGLGRSIRFQNRGYQLVVVVLLHYKKNGSRLELKAPLSHDEVVSFYREALKDFENIKFREWKDAT